jgi:hypothetical protein
LEGSFGAGQHRSQPGAAARITSRVKIPSGHPYTELIGGSQQWDRNTWSYLALADSQGTPIEVGPSFQGVSFDLLAQVNGRYFWAVASRTVEGAKSWPAMAISRDSGRSWKVVDLAEVFDRVGRQRRGGLHIQEILSVNFQNAQEGAMAVRLEETGTVIRLVTGDGGFGWKIKD